VDKPPQSLSGLDNVMGIILLVLVLAVILGGLGFAVHVLWWIAFAVLVVWLLGFLIRVGEGAGRSRYRWYRW
jgi:membrane protein YdbS with pleckstrin-like domain